MIENKTIDTAELESSLVYSEQATGELFPDVGSYGEPSIDMFFNKQEPSYSNEIERRESTQDLMWWDTQLV